MTASLFDSPLFARLFATGETGRLFSDTAALRAMLLVEGALAKVQGNLGMIPETSAAAIQRATLEIQIDPGALAASTGENGVCVPGLVAAFRKEMHAPEHAQYLHWGATSQDIIDTALMLRLRQALALAETDLREVLAALADMADRFAELPMAGRTYGQQATPTSWGAVIAGWGQPLTDALEALPALRAANLWVSLSGAAGTGSVFGAHAPALRAAFAQGLGLKDPGRSWHTDRGPLLRIAGWMGTVTATCGAIGRTLVALNATETGEILLATAGASSTMPQKHNPVGPSALIALDLQMGGLLASLHASAAHQHQRDAGAWFTEWMVMPQIALTAAAALQHAKTIAPVLRPDTARMEQNLAQGLGLIHAEALSFALAARMSRPKAQIETRRLCAKVAESGRPLAEIARETFPDLPSDLFDPGAQMGEAVSDARAFAARVRAL
jgi:3-carboxy-cis,cis-muconate cycloisomerase